MSECGLTPAEVAALFDDSPATLVDADIADQPADPSSYLAGLKHTSTKPAGADKACSLDLVVALAAKPLVILTGTSGTGKSRATLVLAEQLQTLYEASVPGQIFQLVAVGPDWTSPKKLLGYRTPFGQERTMPDGSKTNDSYEITETLRVILRAWHPNATKIPHFLVFDEMNLSHVERYFAPFLSLMEAANILEDTEKTPVVDRASLTVISALLNLEDKESAEAQSAALLVGNEQPLQLPPNLFYVGTVNIDETTYMFSPKVLDRAHVLEMTSRRPSDYVSGEKESGLSISVDVANQLLREAIDSRETTEPMTQDPSSALDLLHTKFACDKDSVSAMKETTLKVLDGCFHLLKPVGFEFAYRVVKEVHDYLFVWVRTRLAMGASTSEAITNWTEGLDRAILQKVLPKIHGNRAALGDSLKAVAAFLSGKSENDSPAARYALSGDATIGIPTSMAITLPAGSSLSRSHAKLLDMHSQLITRNHTSFVK